MPINFEVNTDSKSRVVDFSPVGSEETVSPKKLGQDYAGENIMHKDEEYGLDGQGNLIHPSVEVPKGVKLGKGAILLGKGVEFLDGDEENPETHEFDIEAHALIIGTRIGSGFHIAHHAIVLADSLGSSNTIGDNARVNGGVTTGNGVNIRPSGRVGARASIGSNTYLSRNVKIPEDGRIGSKVFIAHTVELVPPSYARSGPSIFVADGVRIETPRKKITSDVRESILASH